ncbi:probable G patch domain-containing protein 4 at N-terminal half [Coccomyxa sp. Obi]|nr:probable G patch domain-containing protein 4 at N-terminal half [Coccomyxa sp. Obi]
MKLPPGYVPGQGVHKATAYGGFGEKLMKQMGWQEGQGLGRDQKGMKRAIEVKHKEDNIGVGGKAGFAWEKKWWEEAYDSKAKKIQALVEDLDSDDSDDDVIVHVNRDGTRSSAASHEQKIAAALAKDPWGRFGGREGKMARIARQEAELLARLQTEQSASTSQSSGHADATVAVETRAAADIETGRSPGAKTEREEKKAEKRKRAAEGSEEAPQTKKKKKAAGVHAEGERGGAISTEQQGADTAGAKAAKKREKQQKKRAAEQGIAFNKAACDAEAAAAGDNAPSRRQVHVVRLAKDDASASAPFRSTAASGWWGASRFRSAGCLEGLEHTAEHVKKERQSFTEQTQEDLYTATQAAKATAKKGLGIASMPRKVAGARWQGTKTLIEEDAEDGTGPQAVDAAEHGGAAEERCLQNAKWKKLAKAALLKRAERCMTAKRLKQEVVKTALAKAGVTVPKATRKVLQDAMLTKVSSSSLFAVNDGIVQLR